jgi:uncharacterized protein YdeI (YjbR/CyaY-like superfamily)
MPTISVGETLYVPDRAAWRAWLEANHDSKREIWLVYDKAGSDRPSIPYLHAVEEALCFGWIDGIQKKLDDERSAQRFTPRRPSSNWTELNKNRARRLIAEGRMTDAGRAKLPDLALDAFRIPDDILRVLQSDPETWANFQRFPDAYQRVRIGYVEEQRRNRAEFERRLHNFLAKTKANRMFGTWE